MSVHEGDPVSELDPVDVDQAGTTEHVDDEDHLPKGTIVIVSAFLLVTAAVWLWTFYLLKIWG